MILEKRERLRVWNDSTQLFHVIIALIFSTDFAQILQTALLLLNSPSPTTLCRPAFQ